MSDQTAEDKKIEEAKEAYATYLKEFEAKYGYGVGVVSEITPDGRIQSLLKLVKLVPPSVTESTPDAADYIAQGTENEENSVESTSNGDSTTEETRESDSGEQQESKAE